MFPSHDPEEELHFRNLYKAGQRRVADEKRKRRQALRIYNDAKYNQLELSLMSNPDQKAWLLDKLRQ